MTSTGNLCISAFVAAFFLPTFACQAAEFPEGASVPSAEELRQHLSERTFAITLADGTVLNANYKSNGYFFTDQSWPPNFRSKGQWHPENGRLCTKLSLSTGPFTSGVVGDTDDLCAEARMHDGHLYIKSLRANHQILRYEPK